jgi:hypothetical protein
MEEQEKKTEETKPDVRVRDLEPEKDAKGGGGFKNPQGPGKAPQGPGKNPQDDTSTQ